MYRTGDLVRQLENGRIQYLRRADHQIKLRGFRIELEEIERAIVESGLVEMAVVALKLDQTRDARLVAYLKAPAEAAAVDTEQLRELLLQRLPEYMVPSYFMVMEDFPLTANLKIDRKSLPNPAWSNVGRRKDYVAPKTASEKLLAGVWSEVLGIEHIGVNDSLLELGADSLKMFQIAARATRKGLRVSAKQLMKLRTISAITADLNRTVASDNRGSEVAPVVRVSRDKYRVRVPDGQEVTPKA